MSKFLISPFIVIFFLIAVSGRVNAQPKSKAVHYSTEDGLSHDIITSIFKDSEGFMWFGTWDGINRFDGHRFLSFKSSPGDMSQLKNDRIQQITEDKANHLWIRAYDGHIYRFDKGTQQFSPLASILKLPKLSHMSINNIIAVEGNMLWLAAENKGLIWVPDTRPGSAICYTYNKEGKGGFKIPANNVNFLKKDNEGKIWVGTSGGLINLVKDANGIFQAHTPNPGNFNQLDFSAVAEWGNKLYFATNQGQLVIYNKRGHSFSTLTLSKSGLNALKLDSVRKSLYVTTSAGELITLNITTLNFSTFVYNKGAPLLSIYMDRTGNL
jgi:ligand-binding sensor domain-containing protein